MSIYQTAFSNTRYTPIFSGEWSDASMDEETSFGTPNLSSTDQHDLNTLKVWEHFHAMPTRGDQSTWNQFFHRQYTLENPAPVTTSAFIFHQVRSHLAGKAKPAEQGIPDKPEIKVFPKLLHEDVRFRCPIKLCSMIYPRKDALRDHVYHVHPEQKQLYNTLFKLTPKADKKFPCSEPDCKSGFLRKYDLKHHRKEKHNLVEPAKLSSPLSDRPYACSLPGCTYRYSTKKSLRYHIRKKH